MATPPTLHHVHRFLPKKPEDIIKIVIEKDGIMPYRMTEGAAGLDISCPSNVRIEVGEVVKINVKVQVQLPEEYGALLFLRSSFSTKGAVLLGGVIDNDYRGPLYVVVANISSVPITMTRGYRFAQLVPVKTGNLTVNVVQELGTTERGEGSFGSTDGTDTVG